MTEYIWQKFVYLPNVDRLTWIMAGVLISTVWSICKKWHQSRAYCRCINEKFSSMITGLFYVTAGTHDRQMFDADVYAVNWSVLAAVWRWLSLGDSLRHLSTDLNWSIPASCSMSVLLSSCLVHCSHHHYCCCYCCCHDCREIRLVWYFYSNYPTKEMSVSHKIFT